MTAEYKSYDKYWGICLCSFSAPLPNFLPRELWEAFQPETCEQSHSLANWEAATWFYCSSPSKGLINISSSLTAYAFKAFSWLGLYLYPIILNTGMHLLYEYPQNVTHTVLNNIVINEDSFPKIFHHNTIPHFVWSYWRILAWGFFLHSPVNHWVEDNAIWRVGLTSQWWVEV